MTEYLEIGSKNVSALIGCYAGAVAAASSYAGSVATGSYQLGLPFLVTEDIADKIYRPPNLLSIVPKESDIRQIVIDVQRFYHWEEVALLYDGPKGRLTTFC